MAHAPIGESILEGDLVLAACTAESIERERRGKFAVGIGLGQEVFGLPFDGVDGVSTGGPTKRRLILAYEVDQRFGELGGGHHPASHSFVSRR